MRSFPGSIRSRIPSSLASPFTLRRADRNATVAHLRHADLGQQQGQRGARRRVLSRTTRASWTIRSSALTNASVGVPNPATFFDSSAATHAARALHRRARRHRWSGSRSAARTTASTSASSGPARSATRLTWTTTTHALRMGGEFRRNEFDTNLPEEQATEFEKFDNFTMLLRGLATEGDTQFGITDKQFRFNDFNAVRGRRLAAVADR